ncbi:hypothetical protein K9N08_01655 [Candidatus Gracilibacteria bacterium]|nr:hypothetical protein [Candidatus Gracilibacteria bacterium]MCF7856245.1 hypothetical protein [Candidatus Gracilibacteria bacterium]MCF7896690.1 hypothetical protein [Candidatus Gracilibacteria bacterium]
MSINPEIPQSITPEKIGAAARQNLGKEIRTDFEKNAEPKTKDFLEKNPHLALTIENGIDAMLVEPTDYKKEIYERMMFGQKNRIKIQLFAFLKGSYQSQDPELKLAAENFVSEKLAELLKLDKNGNGKLSYGEIIPKDPKERKLAENLLDNAPFCIKMRESKIFDFEKPSVEKNLPAKKDFLKKFLVDFTKKLIDPQTNEAAKGSGLRLTGMLKMIMLQTVGNSQISNAEFNNVWGELLEKEENVQKVYAEASGSEASDRTELTRWMEKEDLDIVKIRLKANQAIQEVRAMEKANPYGFSLRKMGDLKSVLLYFGKDILYGAIGLGIVMSGFNPLKMIQDPVLMGAVAASLGVVKYYNPSFMAGTPKAMRVEQDNLKNSVTQAPEAVQNWLNKFRKNDLNKDGVIEKLLSEKGRNGISSVELTAALREKDAKAVPPDNSEFLASSTEAKTIFQFLTACKKRDLSPDKLDPNV